MLWSDFNGFGRYWDPWRELELVSREFSRAKSSATGEFPAVNVWKAGDNMIVSTEIPGIDPEDIDISAVGKTLTLRGSRDPEEVRGDESYHRRERWHGKFTRTLDLPYNIEAEKVDARFAGGVLTISLPRAEAEKPKKIEIKSE